jgi:hypothetical protein
MFSPLLVVGNEAAYIARGYLKVDPKQVTLEQARELAARYPVFRIDALESGSAEQQAAYSVLLAITPEGAIPAAPSVNREGHPGDHEPPPELLASALRPTSLPA